MQSWQKRDFQIGGGITLFCIVAKQDGTPEMKIFLVCWFNDPSSANAKQCSSISGVQSSFDTLFMRYEHWIAQNQFKACLYSTAKIGHYTFFVHCHSHPSPLPLPTPLTSIDPFKVSHLSLSLSLCLFAPNQWEGNGKGKKKRETPTELRGAATSAAHI